MNAIQEHAAHTANARADYLSEAFGDEARLLAAQDRDQYLIESIAAGLRRVAVASGCVQQAGLLLKYELQVVVTKPVAGETPAKLARLDEVAYVVTTRDDGRFKLTTSQQWLTVEEARVAWLLSTGSSGCTYDADATTALSVWYDNVRHNGYCR